MSDVEAVLDTNLLGESQDTRSIAILREFEPADGYWFANSFGKDSTVVRDLLQRSGVRYEAHHGLTTIDPPELIQFGKREHQETIIDKPRFSFWEHVVGGGGRHGGLPLRQARWCCEEFKECWGVGRRVVTGVRAAESSSRSKRGMVEICMKPGFGKQYVKPIFFWSTDEVWEYIRRRDLPYCSLYDEGWHRLGCVMCPFESRMDDARKKWPKMFDGLLRAIRRRYPKSRGMQKFGSPEAVMEFWLSRPDKRNQESDEQMAFDQWGEDGD